MPHYLLLSAALLSSITAYGQAPPWAWAQGAGSGQVDEASDICADGNGNYYITGYFAGNAINLGGTTLTNTLNNNTADLLLAKVTTGGTVAWVERLGGSGNQAGVAVACTPQGQVVVAGTYENTVQVGPFALTSSSGIDVFVALFSADGSPQWATSMGSSQADYVKDVAVGPDGQVVVVGEFYGDTFTAGAFDLANGYPGDGDLFVVALDANGTVLWGDAAGGQYEDQATAVGIDADGGIVVGGFFACAQLSFGGTTLTNANDNVNDLFLVKYTADGTVQWAKRAGGSRHERIWALACHANGDIAVTGGFNDATMDLLGTVLTNTTDDQSWYDLFVARFSADGQLLWAVADGGIYDDLVTTLAVDADGNTIVGGYFDSPAPLFGTHTPVHVEDYDAFVVQYSPSGVALWAQSAGGEDGDEVAAVACSPNGAIGVVGRSTSEPFTVGDHTLANVGDVDLWVAQLGTATGLSEAAAHWALNTYPNPTNGSLTVEAPWPMHHLQVLDALGRTVQQHAPRTTQVTLVLDRPGAYVVRVSTAEGTSRSMVMVE